MFYGTGAHRVVENDGTRPPVYFLVSGSSPTRPPFPWINLFVDPEILVPS